MEIDKQTIKALAADTRVEILKSLRYRRKTPSELSKELDLAPSTIFEHLNKLENAGLIKREETGHKWIYYNLTNKGQSLVKPKYPIQFIIVLSLGLLFVFGGIFRYFSVAPQFAEVGGIPLAAPAAEIGEAVKAIQVPSIDWLLIGLLSIGIILIIVSLIKLKKK